MAYDNLVEYGGVEAQLTPVTYGNLIEWNRLCIAVCVTLLPTDCEKWNANSLGISDI